MAKIGKTEVRIGCQGFSEADWQGTFYPADLKPGDRLSSYASALDFVEIDSTFYSVPYPSTVQKWSDATPPGFLFAAKLPQAVTHDPDPKTGFPRHPLAGENWQATLELFAERIRLLGDKLAAVVVQLPPQWHYAPEKVETLETFLAALPKDLRFALEFRHKGWLIDPMLDLLRIHGVSLVLQDLYYMPRLVETTTTGLAYIRLQGRRKEITRMNEIQIQRDDALDFWTGAVLDLAAQGVKRVIVAANNHYQGFSPGTVAALQRRLGFPVSVPPSRSQGQLPLA
jgi:uncharacterized protein YecE (DUF72 family)